MFFFFFQAEDGIRDIGVTGVQTCALPICTSGRVWSFSWGCARFGRAFGSSGGTATGMDAVGSTVALIGGAEIGRGAWRGRREISGGAVSFKKKKKKINNQHIHITSDRSKT